MIVLGCVLIGQGIYALRVGLEGELDQLEHDREFATDTRERVFTIETLLEAEGIVKGAGQDVPDEPSDPDGGETTQSPDAPDAGEPEGVQGPGEAPQPDAGDDDDKPDLEGEPWTADDSTLPGTDTLD